MVDVNKSHINMSEEQHGQQLQRRHLRGAIYENLYRLSLVLAVVALVTLLVQISSAAFGPVLVVPTTPLYELTDVPREDLTEQQIAELLVSELGTNLLTIVRGRYGSVQDSTFPNRPIAETLRGNELPASVAEQAGDVSYNDLSDEQLAEFLVLNTSRNELLEILELRVIEPDIIGEWSWITWIFDRNRVYNESAEQLTPDVAREALRAANDEESETTLAEALAQTIPEAEANTVVEQLTTIEETLVTTEWNVENRRRDASLEISERRGGGRQTSQEVTNLTERNLRPDLTDIVVEAGDVERIAATNIAESLASDIVRNDGLEELDDSNEREILSALLIPSMADVLRADGYRDGEVQFISWLDGRFLTKTGSNSVPELVTLRVAIFGTLWVMLIVIITSFPIGVGAAIYLEEYATDNWLNNLIETNIRNLAGVPSIIYGLLGLAVFVRGLRPLTSGAVFGAASEGDTGRTVLSAGLTLSLLILPVIIINSQEAVRAVPRTIREASYGLGATKWQTIWRQILPAAFPGILTGTILAFSRAVGETAPLIVVGAAAAISVDPTLFSDFTVIPIQIFNWTSDARPEYAHLAAAAIVVLLGILILLNSTAIVLRNRFSQPN